MRTKWRLWQVIAKLHGANIAPFGMPSHGADDIEVYVGNGEWVWYQALDYVADYYIALQPADVNELWYKYPFWRYIPADEYV